MLLRFFLATFRSWWPARPERAAEPLEKKHKLKIEAGGCDLQARGLAGTRLFSWCCGQWNCALAYPCGKIRIN
jgi:hypothetical protein